MVVGGGGRRSREGGCRCQDGTKGTRRRGDTAIREDRWLGPYIYVVFERTYWGYHVGPSDIPLLSCGISEFFPTDI